MGNEERRTLNAAIKQDTLIPLRVLNSPFPDQRARAILSYAESNSLVEFIIEEHGAAKLAELSANLGEAMTGLDIGKLTPEEMLSRRGW